jgi:hypothetical protein
MEIGKRGFIFTFLAIILISFLLIFALYFTVLPARYGFSKNYKALDSASIQLLNLNPTNIPPSSLNYKCYSIYKNANQKVSVCG